MRAQNTQASPPPKSTTQHSTNRNHHTPPTHRTPFLEAARAGHAPVLQRLVEGVARQLSRGLRHEIAPAEGEGAVVGDPIPYAAAKRVAAGLLGEDRAHGGRGALWCVWGGFVYGLWVWECGGGKPSD